MNYKKTTSFFSLGHKGVKPWWCLSYDATWQCLRQLTYEAGYLDMVRNGHWIWIYDNLNFNQTVRHERSGLYTKNSTINNPFVPITHGIVYIDVHPEMMNVTARLAVQIKYLLQGTVNWSDTQPQKKRSELALDDIVPSEGDGLMMYNRAVNYVMRFMASHFKALSKFLSQVPHLKSPHVVSPSIVAPMKILHKDEKYTEANVEILECIMSDAHLNSDPQVCILVVNLRTCLCVCVSTQGDNWRPTYLQEYVRSKVMETS